MRLENINDIKSEIKTFEYGNGHVSYSVITKYHAHTLINQVSSLSEADSIIENHIGYIVSIYAGSDYIYDPLTKSIIKRPIQVDDSSTSKKRGKKKEKEVIKDELEEVPIIDTDDADDEYDYDADDRLAELNGSDDDFTAPDNYSEDSYDSIDDYYDNDNDD